MDINIMGKNIMGKMKNKNININGLVLFSLLLLLLLYHNSYISTEYQHGLACVCDSSIY